MGKFKGKIWLFRLIMLLYLGAVAYLCFANFDKVQDMPKTLFGIPLDKIVHFCMFFPFPIIAFFSYDRKTDRPIEAVAAAVVSAAVGGIFAGLTEIVQGSLPYRTQDIADFHADLIAIGISAILVVTVDLLKMRKKK